MSEDKKKKSTEYIIMPKRQMDPNWRDGLPKSIVMAMEDEMKNGKHKLDQ